MLKLPHHAHASRDQLDDRARESAATAGSTGFDLEGFLGLGRGLVQARGELRGDDAHAWASHGVSTASSALPHADAIQRSFGHHDVSGVRAAVGGNAAEASSALGAHAYATGDRVAFSQAPDLHLAAHEAAHVVQQRGGVRLSDGLGRPGDAYEQHADAVADLVVRGESAEALLDTMAHRGPAGGAAVQGSLIQRKDGPASTTEEPAPAGGGFGSGDYKYEFETLYGKVEVEGWVKAGAGQGEEQEGRSTPTVAIGTHGSNTEGWAPLGVTANNFTPEILRGKLGLEIPYLADSLSLRGDVSGAYRLGFTKAMPTLGPVTPYFSFNLIDVEGKEGHGLEPSAGTMSFRVEIATPKSWEPTKGVIEVEFKWKPDWPAVMRLLVDGELATTEGAEGASEGATETAGEEGAELASEGGAEATEGTLASVGEAGAEVAGEAGTELAGEAAADLVLVGEISTAAATSAAAIILLAPVKFFQACLADLSEQEATKLRVAGLSYYRNGYNATLTHDIFPSVSRCELAVTGYDITAEEGEALSKAMKKGISDGSAAFAKLDPAKVKQLRATGASGQFSKELDAKLMAMTGSGF
jgi:hypothetical protein